MDPAEIFLEVVFRFWHEHGYRIAEDLTPEEIKRPSKHDFGHFMQEPYMVRIALEVWLQEGADLPASAAVVPTLALWFRDPWERLPEEETTFFAQWWDYLKRRRMSRRGAQMQRAVQGSICTGKPTSAAYYACGTAVWGLLITCCVNRSWRGSPAESG
jgi:hypothetical protein